MPGIAGTKLWWISGQKGRKKEGGGWVCVLGGGGGGGSKKVLWWEWYQIIHEFYSPANWKSDLVKEI